MATRWSYNYSETNYSENDRRPFKVVIPNGELAQIQQWVRKYPNIETGGDLFGLWSQDNTAVVQLVLGPGENSRRTSVSYYQDTKYLAKAGSVLTRQYGLCHIGEWHSHHTLGLAQPSGGDQNTVWSNMPNNGFKRFIIFIANLDKETRSRKLKGGDLPVGLGCFLFEVKNTQTWQRCDMMQGSFEVTEGQSPYRRLQGLSLVVNEGAESVNKNHEIGLKHVQQGWGRHEGSNILLYNKDEEFGDEGLERLPYKGNAYQPRKLVSPSEKPPTQKQQYKQSSQTGLIVAVESAKQFNGKGMWATLKDQHKKLLLSLKDELQGQLVHEINTITVSFMVRVPPFIELACWLVCELQQIDVLKFYLLGSAQNCKEIKPFDQSHDVDPVQLVKDEVAKHVTVEVDQIIAANKLTATQATPLQVVNTQQQPQQQQPQQQQPQQQPQEQQRQQQQQEQPQEQQQQQEQQQEQQHEQRKQQQQQQQRQQKEQQELEQQQQQLQQLQQQQQQQQQQPQEERETTTTRTTKTTKRTTTRTTRTKQQQQQQKHNQAQEQAPHSTEDTSSTSRPV
ncbi:uncharacterized protein LOC134182283 [Corticium candelabrum]|uniref:uncharacterized protein LOC134182283 n=1 Tax=Corticium candelabrum TaxID=121492 RepID=UPI002E2629BE|nr:uncharacterized protein LOC134182283 [Corticium candelabrum]